MNYKTALFEKYVVPRSDKPKALIVLVPGSNGDGRIMTRDVSWRNFAQRNNCALIGCFFQDIDPSRIEGYADASGGSGQALLDYIKRENLDNLPILLYGFSAGGQFNYEFACFAPERVKAFIVNKGGFYYHALAPEATRKIPALWFLGDKDAEHRVYAIAGIYLMNKAANADKWELVVEKCGHSEWGSEETSQKFFKNILKDL